MTFDELKEKYKDGWWEGHDGYSGDEMYLDIKWLIEKVENKSSYLKRIIENDRKGYQENRRKLWEEIKTMRNIAKTMEELAHDLGKENELLRERNEELRDEKEHLEKANLYISRISKNLDNHIAEQYKEIERLKQPHCKKCGHLYPIEYSYHQDYCDVCYKKKKSQTKK